METINYCVVLPENVNKYAEEGSNEFYELYSVITKLLMATVYNDGVLRDICSKDLYWEGKNLIFSYKAVPASASTMSAYPYYHALIITNNSLVI